MIGNHSIPVITDAILKGIPGIDMEKAYEAVYNSSVTSHPNSPFEVWEKYGFMPENIQTQSVSITLEQAFDDWCVAQLAAKLNKDADYQRFHKRSEYYRNLFHPKTKFFQSKNDKGESNLSTRINTVETAGIRLPKEMHGNTFGMFRITSRP